MNRFLLIIVFVLAYTAGFGQKQFRVLDWKAEQTVNMYLLSKLHEQYDSRRTHFQHALQSPENATAYRDSCKVRYRRLLGMLPERADLSVETVGVIQQAGYSIEKIVYESVPGHHVTSNLYIPAGEGPFPGVLLFCGHEDDAKATDSYQRTAILFALNGFVVFVVDPSSQAERHQLTDKDGRPQTRGGTTEHTIVNGAASLVGTGTVAFQLWDNVRALDYLESRQEVDKQRIGCLGNSGGGTQTTFLLAFDDRIKVASTCSFIASRERNFEWFGPSDGCSHILFEGQAQLEISDYLIMFAPKPVLVLAGKYDFVDYYGTTKAYSEAKALYRAMGSPEKIDLFSVEDGHGISYPKRAAAVQWFRKWLYADSATVVEKDLKVLSRDELSVTGVGQVNSRFNNEQTEFVRMRKMADQYLSQRSPKNVKANVQTVLKVHLGKEPVTPEHRGTVDHNGFTFQKILLRKEGQMPLPVLVVMPSPSPKEVVVLVHERGKHVLADSLILMKRYHDENIAVVLADVSGIGELKDPEIVNDPKYFNSEYRNAMLGIHVGEPLPALRARDILTVIDFVSNDATLKNLSLRLISQGLCSIPALHAAVLDERIRKVYAINFISSFYEIINNPLKKNSYSHILPGVLQYYDVTDLVKYLDKRAVIIH